MQLILVERLDATGQPTHRPLSLIATGEDIPALRNAVATVLEAVLRRPLVSLHQATTPLVPSAVEYR